MQTASTTGFYGKLPCKGDFLQRRVTQEFVDTWDAWLQECMVASREQLQERWLDAYLTSPVWRFALAEGVCGSGAYIGVMVPSVDRVGRYFPFTLVAQLSGEDYVLEVACDAGRQWFDAAESLALGALEAHDLDLSAFDEQVAALGGPTEAAESAYLRQLMQNSQLGRRPGQWQVPLESVHSLQRAANVLGSRELERTLRPLVLWWTDGSNAITPSWLCNRGLPPPSSFAALIAGGWDRFGWESLGAPLTAAQAPLPVAVADSMGADVAAAALVEIVMCHAALSRQPAAAPRGHFVSRPDVGLWGFSSSDGNEAGASEAQMIADVLHDISTAGSVSSLAEEVRRALEVMQRQRATSAVYSGAGNAGAVVFLARGNECAVVCAGSVQAVRTRSREVTSIEGTSDDIVVHYDTVRVGDVWVLAGALMFDDQLLASLPALLAQHPAIDEGTVVAAQHLWARGSGVDQEELPLMLLAASSVRMNMQRQ
jgi:type VI secretion system ImpM family protein